MNGDKAAPGVVIDLGGKKRQLVFDMWAFLLLEKETGRNALSGEMFHAPSATDIVVLVWAALQGGPEKLSLEQVGRMLNFENLPLVSKAIQDAFAQASPAPAEPAKNDEADARKPVASAEPARD